MLWATIESSGRPIPLDPDPVPNGSVTLVGLKATVLKRDEDPGPDVKRYMPHHATCDKGKEWQGVHRGDEAAPD